MRYIVYDARNLVEYNASLPRMKLDAMGMDMSSYDYAASS
jgi:hypothetical protein